MFDGEQRELVTDEGKPSVVPMLIWLFNTYAGLSTAVAGFVLDNAVLVGVGLLLVVSGSMLAGQITKVMNRSQSVRLDFYEEVSGAHYRIHR
jgi:NAD/NADP transhydrogenase beta subunit